MPDTTAFEPLPDDHQPQDTVHEVARRSRRGLIAAIVAALLVLVLGGAAYGVYQYLDGGGPRPEEALPGSTVALMSIDLDPKAGQKIEAIKTLRKFPALRDTLGIDSQDDLRRYAVEEGLAEVCEGLDYENDVQPWIGNRAAVAAVDLGDDLPAPALVLQVSDKEKAEKGFEELVSCGEEEGLPADFGFAVGEDYLIASDSVAHAEKILAEGEQAPLAEDKTYEKWSEEAGGSGIVNFYLAPSAATFLGELVDSFLSGMGTDFSDAFGAELGDELERQGLDSDDPLGAVKEQLEEFDGAAGAIRFADGGMELTFAARSGAADDLEGGSVGSSVTRLPADTALALGLGIPEGFVATLVEQATEQGGPEVESFLAEAETQTGLDLPDDLATLLGQGLTLSIGGDAPSTEDLEDPEKVPVGLTLRGDPDAALDVIGTAEENLGLRLADIPVVTDKDGDRLVLSPSSAYAEALTKDGGLGRNALFEKAVPDAENAQFVLFVAIDAAWRAAIVDLAGGGLSPEEAAEIEDNLAPFGAFGLSSTVKDGVGRFQLRIATR